MSGDERHGAYPYMDDDELADHADYCRRRAIRNERLGNHDAAQLWRDSAQLAQDDLDARKEMNTDA